MIRHEDKSIPNEIGNIPAKISGWMQNKDIATTMNYNKLANIRSDLKPEIDDLYYDDQEQEIKFIQQIQN